MYMGAMKALDISSNTLCAEGTKLLAETRKGNQMMTELDLSSNYMTEEVAALADAIPNSQYGGFVNIEGPVRALLTGPHWSRIAKGDMASIIHDLKEH
jgi:hypothetical protein